MVKLANNTTISWFNYFYLFCIIIYAGSATEFTRSLGNPITIGNAFALLISFIFCYNNKITFKKEFVNTIFIYSIYAVLTFINNGMISPMWYSQIIIFLFLAYTICQGYNKTFFVLYETILYHLSIIAIILWLIYIISPDFVNTIVSIFQFDKVYDENIESKNMIVYTLLSGDRQTNEYISVLRNAGFAWEPGAFSCMVCLAIYCNILRTNFKIRNNRYLFIFIIALLTTFSTTGYVIFITMMIMWFILNKRYILGVLLIPLFLIIFNLPFVQEKMLTEYYNVSNVNIHEIDKWNTNSVALGRIASFIYDWEEFLRHPILGLGGYAEGTWLAMNGYKIVTISGIGKLLSMYGIVMASLFFILLIKSSKFIGNIFNSKLSWLLPFIMIGVMISYNLWLTPLFIAFWIHGIFGDRCLASNVR